MRQNEGTKYGSFYMHEFIKHIKRQLNRTKRSFYSENLLGRGREEAFIVMKSAAKSLQREREIRGLGQGVCTLPAYVPYPIY